MSFRTILVGIIAAACGIFATAGVLMMNMGKTQGTVREPAQVVIANIGIGLGQEITPELLATMEWFGEALPAGAFVDKKDLIGKFAQVTIAAGDLVVVSRIADTPSVLQVSPGMRGYAIESKSESTSVGKSLIPGNRVDVIWQTDLRNAGVGDDIPRSMRLLQNVKVIKADENGKSITLEVKPTMEQSLGYAQSMGSLSLSVRNPADNDGVDPIEEVRLEDVVREIREKVAARDAAERLKSQEKELGRSERRGLDRIPAGMRAITIQTPSESSGLAGLLEPGDRVDLQFTLSDKSYIADAMLKVGSKSSMPTELMIENIEVFAVDTNIEVENDVKKQMSKSVTLIILQEMQLDIARAQELGKVILLLRGKAEQETGGAPRTMMSMNEFVARYMPEASNVVASTTRKQVVRTYRGQATDELQFARN